jgi:hypothetical protein
MPKTKSAFSRRQFVTVPESCSLPHLTVTCDPTRIAFFIRTLMPRSDVSSRVAGATRGVPSSSPPQDINSGHQRNSKLGPFFAHFLSIGKKLKNPMPFSVPSVFSVLFFLNLREIPQQGAVFCEVRCLGKGVDVYSPLLYASKFNNWKVPLENRCSCALFSAGILGPFGRVWRKSRHRFNPQDEAGFR